MLIIRHAEDGGIGRALAPRGEQRAEAYKDYFLKFTVDSKGREPQAIFAAKDSKQSHRPRLTVEPFAKAAELRIDTRFGNNQSADLAADLRANQQGKVILYLLASPIRSGSARCIGSKPQNLSAEGQMARCGLRLGYPAQLRSGRPFDSVELKTDQRTPVAGRLSVVRCNFREKVWLC